MTFNEIVSSVFIYNYVLKFGLVLLNIYSRVLQGTNQSAYTCSVHMIYVHVRYRT